MTAMHKQTFFDYDDYGAEQSPMYYGHNPGKVQNSVKNPPRKSGVGVKPTGYSSRIPERATVIRPEHTRTQRTKNTAASTRSTGKTRSTKTPIATSIRTSTKKRSETISAKNKTSHSSVRSGSKKNVEPKRSARIDRAMQKRQKRLAEMERRHMPGGQLSAQVDGLSAGEIASPTASRLRTRVRYLHTPQKTIVGRIFTKPVETVRRRVHFFVVLAGMFIGGLMLTLWLTSQSAMSAYEQDRLSNRNAILNNYVNELTKELAEGNSSPVLKEKAAGMGMVPASDINVLQHKGKTWSVYGIEKRVQGPKVIPGYFKKSLPPNKRIPPTPQPFSITPAPANILPMINPATSGNGGTTVAAVPPGNITMNAVQMPSMAGSSPISAVPVKTLPANSSRPINSAGGNDLKPEMPIMPGDPDLHDAPIQPLTLQSPPSQSNPLSTIPLPPAYSDSAQAQFIPDSPNPPLRVWRAPPAN